MYWMCVRGWVHKCTLANQRACVSVWECKCVHVCVPCACVCVCVCVCSCKVCQCQSVRRRVICVALRPSVLWGLTICYWSVASRPERQPYPPMSSSCLFPPSPSCLISLLFPLPIPPLFSPPSLPFILPPSLFPSLSLCLSLHFRTSRHILSTFFFFIFVPVGYRQVHWMTLRGVGCFRQSLLLDVRGQRSPTHNISTICFLCCLCLCFLKRPLSPWACKNDRVLLSLDRHRLLEEHCCAMLHSPYSCKVNKTHSINEVTVLFIYIMCQYIQMLVVVSV